MLNMQMNTFLKTVKEKFSLWGKESTMQDFWLLKESLSCIILNRWWVSNSYGKYSIEYIYRNSILFLHVHIHNIL